MLADYEPICKCGNVMLLRKNRADGSQFYGCSKYPQCTETLSIRQVERKAARLALSREERLRWAEQVRLNLDKPNYYKYLRSVAWRRKKFEALQSARYKCQICKKDRIQGTLDVHHRSYEHLGHELPSDLIVLCRCCHALYHDKLSSLQ